MFNLINYRIIEKILQIYNEGLSYCNLNKNGFEKSVAFTLIKSKYFVMY